MNCGKGDNALMTQLVHSNIGVHYGLTLHVISQRGLRNLSDDKAGRKAGTFGLSAGMEGL